MNLSKLDPEEQEEAIKILASIGLRPEDLGKFQKKASKALPSPSPSLPEYILRRETTCSLCKAKTACFFKMQGSPKGSELQGLQILTSKELLNNELEIRTTEHSVLTCPNCTERLERLSKEDLIQLLLIKRNSLGAKLQLPRRLCLSKEQGSNEPN